MTNENTTRRRDRKSTRTADSFRGGTRDYRDLGGGDPDPKWESVGRSRRPGWNRFSKPGRLRSSGYGTTTVCSAVAGLVPHAFTAATLNVYEPGPTCPLIDRVGSGKL